MRTKSYGQGDQLCVQFVTYALAVISETYQLVGEQSPIYQTEGECILPIKSIIDGFIIQDPPSFLQLAVPKEVPEMAQKLAYLTGNTKVQATGYLSIIAFYYLLRSGKYKKARKLKQNGKLVIATRKQQIRFKDVWFWKKGEIISRNEALNKRLGAY